MFIIKYYILGALISLLAAIYIPQIMVSLLFLWVSLSLALVSVAPSKKGMNAQRIHLTILPSWFFRKRLHEL